MKNNRTNKLISLALAVIMLIGMIPMGVMTASAAPDTDYTGYYQLKNAGNLAWFACLVVGDDSQPGSGITEAVPDAKAVLTADIDITVLATTLKKTWVGIGSEDIPFTGVFDGNGYTIKGLTTDTSLTQPSVATIAVDTAKQGLFGVIGEGGVVRDVIVEGTATLSDTIEYGGICSENNGTIENVLSKITVTGGKDADVFCHTNNGVITNSFADKATAVSSGVTVVDADTLASGSVAYALGASFGQTIGTDTQPVHNDGTNTVYFDGEAYYNNNHTHDWRYMLGDVNLVRASCGAEDCPYTNGGTFTISAPADLYADGSAKEAVIDNQLVDTEAEISEITYSTSDGKAPTKPGTYTASVTVEGMIAKVEFTLLSYAASVTDKDGDPIGTYKTLDEAITAAGKSEGSKVTLLDNVTLITRQTIASGKFTLDLAGKKITGSAQFCVYIKGSDTELTIDDSGEGGKIESTSTTATSSALYIYDGAVNINGGTIAHIGKASLPYGIYNGGILNVYGGEISVTSGYGIYNGDTADIYGGTVKSNYHTIYNSRDIKIHGGTFRTHTTDYTVYNNTKGTISISGGEYNDGLIFYDYNKTLTLNDIIAEGHSYYDANGKVITPASGATEITGYVKVANAPAKIENENYALSYVKGNAIPAPAAENFTITSDEGAAVTFEWYSGTQELDAMPTEAGTYTLKVLVAKGEKYEAGSAEFTVTILPAVASVIIGSETKYYATIDEAWAAVDGNTATLTLIDNCTTESGLLLNGGDVTLDTAEYTLTAESFNVYGGKLTVKGSGELVHTGKSACICVFGGKFLLESGTVGGIFVNADLYSSADAKATINNGTVNSHIQVVGTSDTYSATLIVNDGTFAGSINVHGTPDIQLNGGKFTANSTLVSGSSDYTFADILGEGKAYYNANGEMIVLTDGQKEITEPFYVANAPATIINKNYALSYVKGNTIPAPAAENFTITSDEGAAVTFEWYSGTQELDAMPTEAGTYTLRVLVAKGENYEAGSAEFTVTILPAVASVTTDGATKCYATIDEAITAATKAEISTVTLMADCKTDKNLELYGKDMTLDTSKYTIEIDYLYATNGSKLTMKGNGVIAGNANEKSFINVTNGSELIVESGTFDGQIMCYTHESAKADSKVTINNGTVYQLKVDGESDTYKATITVNGGTITGNQILVYYDGVLILNACEFTADSVSLFSAPEDSDFAALLGEGKAYYNANGEMIVLSDGQTKINEPFTVGNIADEIARIKAAVEAYDVDTVTSADIQAIASIKTNIGNVRLSASLTAEQTATLDASSATIDSLLGRVTNVLAAVSNIGTTVKAYDVNTVKSSDKADIEQLKADIKALTDGKNITAKERATLEAHDATLDTLLAKISSTADEIDRIVSVINSYDADSVKSSDKADIQQLIADIKALTDGENITENERVNLEYFDSQADKLIAKIDEVAAEITRLEEAVNAYNVNTVKSSDKDAINEIIGGIDELLATDNLTDDEITGLEEAKADAEKLIEKIEATAEEIARIEETANAYDIDTVKSTDKTAIEQLIADIKALTGGANLTDNERLLLDAYKANLEKMVEKLDATAKEIDRINNAVNGYSDENVKSSDAEAIDKLIEDIKALTDGENITDEEKAALEALDATADELNEKIDEVAAEKKRVEDAAAGYSEDTVKSSDAEAIDKLIEDIKALTDGGNLTDEENEALEETLADAQALADKIDEVAAEKKRIEDTMAGYNEGYVNSSDAAAIEQLKDDIKALTDGGNITDEEKKALEAFDTTADEYLEKIAAITTALENLEDDVNYYSVDTVKSTDEKTIEKLKVVIESFDYSSNITDEERSNLNSLRDKLDALTERIEETEKAMADATDKADDFDPATVTSDDKEDINGIIADIDEIITSGNATQEEIADLNETKAQLSALVAKFNEATAKVEALGAKIEMLDKDRVTKFWEDEIEALIAEIDSLLADPNMGTAEIEKLNEYKAQAEEMLEIINTPAEYFSLRFFYLIWDLFVWIFNAIIGLFA